MPQKDGVYKINDQKFGIKLEIANKSSVCWLGICDTETKAKELYDLYILYKLNPEANEKDLYHPREYYKNLFKTIKESGQLIAVHAEGAVSDYQLLYEHLHRLRSPEASNEVEPIIRLKRKASKSVDDSDKPGTKRQDINESSAKSAPKPR